MPKGRSLPCPKHSSPTPDFANGQKESQVIVPRILLIMIDFTLWLTMWGYQVPFAQCTHCFCHLRCVDRDVGQVAAARPDVRQFWRWWGRRREADFLLLVPPRLLPPLGLDQPGLVPGQGQHQQIVRRQALAMLVLRYHRNVVHGVRRQVLDDQFAFDARGDERHILPQTNNSRITRPVFFLSDHVPTMLRILIHRYA